MPRLPLARVHRPQRFVDVLGQTAPVRALSAAAAQQDVASAYIFSGTRGVGKTTIARIFAKALNCEQGPAADCCDECTACREIAEGRSLDVLELDAATHTGIDDVRELREAAQYAPGRARRRVFILDEAHQLSQAAWNGLLKILEEPPPWCVFLFCTTEPHKIPATIESRALHFAFRSLTPAQIRERLTRIASQEGLHLERAALDLLVQAADGSVRDGLSALDQVRALGEGPITAEGVRDALGLVPGEAVARFIAALGAGDAAAALGVVALLDEDGLDLRAFTADALERVRRLALVKILGASSEDDAATLASAAQAFGPEQLVWLGKVLDETEMRLRQGGPARALLDLAAVRMTQMANLTPLAELVERLGAGTAGDSGGGAPARPGRSERRTPTTPEGEPRRAPPASLPPAPGEPPPQGAPSLPAGLLGQLVETLQASRPSLAALLRTAESIDFDDDALVVRLPRDKGVHAGRLMQNSSQQALLDAARQLTGRTAAAVRVLAAEGVAGPAPGAPGASRAEVLELARQDPLVRALFDRFGAAVLDGQALCHQPPQEP